jgi:hypothetical protein
MSLAYVTDHETRAAALLTEQFKGQAAVVALLKTWAGQVQGLEDSVHELRLQRALASAEGVNLDLLGAIVGQPRGGRNDAQYRLWIAGRVLVNKSRGKTPQLIAIAAKLVNGPVRLREYEPAAFVIYCDRVITGSDGVEVAKLLKIAKAAGVRMHFVWYDVPTAFRFSTSGSSAFSSSRGFGAGRLGAVSDGRDMVFGDAPPGGPGSGGGGGALLLVL